MKMPMPITTLLPAAAAALFLLFLVVVATSASKHVAMSWALSAGAAALFLVFSLVTVALEGPVGFWVEHTRNLWGNQIWFDLLLAAAVTWGCVWPQARRLGMRPWPWLLLIVCTGSFGLLALVARVHWLRRSLTSQVLDP